MPHRPARHRQARMLVDGHDEIEVASIDSFPASDPPGWIDGTARPREDAEHFPAADQVPGTSRIVTRVKFRNKV
jgi:hypothetical protein